MANKKNVKIGKWLGFGAALLALVAVIMMFLPGLSFTRMGNDETYNVFKIAFGGKIAENSNLGSKTVFKFNFLTCLSVILLILGLLFVVLSVAKIGNGKLMAFLGAVLLIVGGILMFCLVGFTSVTYTISNNTTTAKITEANNVVVLLIENVKLGTGAILAGVFGILGGVAALGKAVLDK